MIMAKTFIVDKRKHDQRKIEKHSKGHKKLDEFYPAEQKEKEQVRSIEDEIFEHLKKHTKKVLEKNK